MDEPRALADQLGDHFRAGNIAFVVKAIVDERHETRTISDDPGADEVVDQLERRVAVVDDIEPAPGFVDIDIEPVVHRLLYVLAMRGGDMEAAAQECRQFTA